MKTANPTVPANYVAWYQERATWIGNHDPLDQQSTMTLIGALDAINREIGKSRSYRFSGYRARLEGFRHGIEAELKCRAIHVPTGRRTA